MAAATATAAAVAATQPDPVTSAYLDALSKAGSATDVEAVSSAEEQKDTVGSSAPPHTLEPQAVTTARCMGAFASQWYTNIYIYIYSCPCCHAGGRPIWLPGSP